MNKPLPKNPEIDDVDAFLNSLNGEDNPSDTDNIVWICKQIVWLANQVKQISDTQALLVDTMRVMNEKIRELYAHE